jgi:hypothetical protein
MTTAGEKMKRVAWVDNNSNTEERVIMMTRRGRSSVKIELAFAAY